MILSHEYDLKQNLLNSVIIQYLFEFMFSLFAGGGIVPNTNLISSNAGGLMNQSNVGGTGMPSSSMAVQNAGPQQQQNQTASILNQSIGGSGIANLQQMKNQPGNAMFSGGGANSAINTQSQQQHPGQQQFSGMGPNNFNTSGNKTGVSIPNAAATFGNQTMGAQQQQTQSQQQSNFNRMRQAEFLAQQRQMQQQQQQQQVAAANRGQFIPNVTMGQTQGPAPPYRQNPVGNNSGMNINMASGSVGMNVGLGPGGKPILPLQQQQFQQQQRMRQQQLLMQQQGKLFSI